MPLNFDPDAVELPFHYFIGGERVAARGVLDLHRPSDGRPCGACPLADAALVDQAEQVAKRAQKASGWAEARPGERLAALRRWADLIEAKAVTIDRLEAVSFHPSDCADDAGRHSGVGRADPLFRRVRRQGGQRRGANSSRQLRHEKQSGLERKGSQLGIEEYLEVKTLHVSGLG